MNKKKMVNLIIDGRKLSVKEGMTILELAKQEGIYIPTLCHHEALVPYGVCRLCVVEVIRKGWPKVVTSCNYPVKEGIEIKTASENALRTRKIVIELLLARCPEEKKIQALAEELGVKETRFRKKDDNCILCGLCFRVCSEIIGVSAISSVNRGAGKEVTTPFKENSDVCIGCGACAVVCPTGAIKIEDIKSRRRLDKWNTEVKLKKCKACDNYFAPVPQLDSIKGKTAVLKDLLEKCPDCRRKYTSSSITKAVEPERKS